jgi:hypothetical protein
MAENRIVSFNNSCVRLQEELLINKAGQIICGLFLLSVVAVTMLGNIMSIVTVIRRGQFHRKISVFVISLAVVDFCVALLVMVPSIIQHFINHSLFTGPVRSRVFLAFDCIFTTSSIFHFTYMKLTALWLSVIQWNIFRWWPEKWKHQW